VHETHPKSIASNAHDMTKKVVSPEESSKTTEERETKDPQASRSSLLCMAAHKTSVDDQGHVVIAVKQKSLRKKHEGTFGQLS